MCMDGGVGSEFPDEKHGFCAQLEDEFLLGLGQAAVGDEAVDVAFGNHYHLLIAAVRKDGTFHPTLAMSGNSLMRFIVAKCFRHIRAAEKGLAVLVEGANLAEVGVVACL